MRFTNLQKEKNNYSKCSVFASFTILHLFFTLNFVIFVDVGRKNISCSRAQGTLATTLIFPLNKNSHLALLPNTVYFLSQLELDN